MESDPSRNFRRGAKWQIMPSGGPLGLRAGYANSSVAPAWDSNLHDSPDRNFGHTEEWSAEVEDLPTESNRVALVVDVVR